MTNLAARRVADPIMSYRLRRFLSAGIAVLLFAPYPMGVTIATIVHSASIPVMSMTVSLETE